MNRLQQLQDRDAAIVKLMAEINDKVAADNRLELSAEETSKYDALKSERESLTKAIARETEILAAQKEILAKGKSTPVVEDEKKVVDTIRFPMGFATPKHFKGPEAKLDAYKSGQFLLASLRGSAKAKQWCDEHGVQVLSQNEGTNTAGGYLVNPEMSSVIIDLRETYGVFRRNCQRMPMSSDTLTMNRRNGGLTAYFKAEEAAYTDSSKSWNQVQLAAKKLTALTYWSNELDDDAIISLADDLASEIAYGLRAG
jgi:HK97 family phage major capsid protein